MALNERNGEERQTVEPGASAPSLKTDRGTSEGRYWRRHLQQWRASGLNQSEYCRRAGISRHAFVNWKRKLGITSGSDTKLVAVPPEIVRGVDRTPPEAPLAVMVKNRFRVEVPVNFDTRSLQRLTAILERS